MPVSRESLLKSPEGVLLYPTNFENKNELFVTLPALNTKDYHNMLRLQEAYACGAVALVLKKYQEETHKSIGIQCQETCELVIAEVLEKHPVAYKI